MEFQADSVQGEIESESGVWNVAHSKHISCLLNYILTGGGRGSCYVALYSYSFSYIRFIYSGAYVTPCNAFCRLQLKCKSNHRARQGQNATTGGRRRRQSSQGGSYHLPASNQVESSQRVHFRMGCFGTDLSRVVAL